jgi:hypothetical protein
MATTAADILIDTLHEWGVDVIFGLQIAWTVLADKVRELV